MTAEERGGGGTERRCWSCRAVLAEGPACPQCGKVQPLGQSADYFSVLGIPRRLGLDAAELEPRFHALSRQYHPDALRAAGARERIIALENSALLNKAYRTLRDPFDRAAYLLQLETGPAAETKDAPPQELFDEILEVQELLGDFKFAEPEEQAPLRGQVQARRDALQAEQDRRAQRLTDGVFPEWDALGEAPDAARREPLLAEMRRLLSDRAYLRRVLNSLNDALDSA